MLLYEGKQCLVKFHKQNHERVNNFSNPLLAKCSQAIRVGNFLEKIDETSLINFEVPCTEIIQESKLWNHMNEFC